MRRHIGYSLAIEQHSTAIAETAHVVITAADHITSSLTPLRQRPYFVDQHQFTVTAAQRRCTCISFSSSSLRVQDNVASISGFESWSSKECVFSTVRPEKYSHHRLQRATAI